MSLVPIDIRDLIGDPGASKTVAVTGTLDALGTELAEVRPDAPVSGSLLLESVIEGIFVTGRITGTLHLRCARCLQEFEAPVAVDLAEMFVVDAEPEADDYPLDPVGFIEPEQMVRDALGVELPFSPLCRPDCKGLCPVCGGDRNQDECPGDHPSTDPRWAELDVLLEQMDN